MVRTENPIAVAATIGHLRAAEANSLAVVCYDSDARPLNPAWLAVTCHTDNSAASPEAVARA